MTSERDLVFAELEAAGVIAPAGLCTGTRMIDMPAVRNARIELRLAELRVLAARTACEFGREQYESWLRLELKSFVQQVVREQFRVKRIGLDGRKPKD
jgi:hypothetical protein